jgi:hypothetical protein
VKDNTCQGSCSAANDQESFRKSLGRAAWLALCFAVYEIGWQLFD